MIFGKMHYTRGEMHSRIQNMLAREQHCECPYFPGMEALYIQSSFETLEKDFQQSIAYGILLEQGFRRSGNEVYINSCPSCSQCTPIRLDVNKFSPSKSQRHVLKINSDIEISINTEQNTFATDEKVALFRDYDFHHNKETSPRMSLEEAKEVLSYSNAGYENVINMEYRLAGRLVGVAILDLAMNRNGILSGLSSNYFYYDVSQEILKRSLGVFSVLQEIELCKNLNIPYYYLGLYLPDCKKMDYKINYKPYELNYYGKWFEMPENPDMLLNPDNILDFPKPGDFDIQYPEICCSTFDLTIQQLYSAYMQGIFPWFDEDKGHPVLWQSPEKRFVIFPDEFHIPKSVEKFLKKNPYTITVDTCFKDVIENCRSMKREDQDGTWIGPKIIKAYTRFAELGYAHSIEVWQEIEGEKQLVGGFYGVLIGSIFFGESMFTKASNSSKAAFVLFAKKFFECGGRLIDCQVYTENMARYNAREIPRKEFLRLEELYLPMPLKKDLWKEFKN